MKIITTSWDDGHPLDFKLAELLEKYQLTATFYIPKTNAEQEVMSEKEVNQLSKKFEIGGHTLNHTRLHQNLSPEILKTEVNGCFNWLAGVTNQQPISFCFPGGVINQRAITAVKKSGFKVLRSTELLSTKSINKRSISPTTIQVFEHPPVAYLKNTLKRSNYKSLFGWLVAGAITDLHRLIDQHLLRIENDGGCLHLWGHSWEIDQYNLWSKLEAVFKQISGINQFQYLENKNLVAK